MVKIQPFRGWAFDTAKAGDITKLVTPPHDVISEKERKAFKKLSKHNILRIILPEGDDYSSAARALDELLSKGMIRQDSKLAYYAYEQEFKQRGKGMRRLGFLALVRAEPLGKDVLPHEQTFPDKVKDRLLLLQESRVETSPVFGLYKGNTKITKALARGREHPLFEFKDASGVVNRVWPVYDTREITDFFKGKKVIIADGHHRYTAASKFAESAKSEEEKFTMMYLVDISDPALKILPTHRLIEDPRFDIMGFIERASEFFDVIKVKDIDELQSRLEKHGKHSFGVHTKDDSYLLKLKDAQHADRLIKEGSSDWKRLDVSVLHALVLDRLLGVPKERIYYAKHQDDIIRMINDKTHHVAFLLPHTDISEVVKIVENSELMPHKSTYFSPKPLAGLVIRFIDR